MTPLAVQIYKQLRRRVRTKQPSITYRELTEALDYRYTTHPRSSRLHAALTEVTRACRAHDLPTIAAIVWSAGRRRPSTGYYRVAHPTARSDEARVAAWEREHARVLRERDRFPPTLA